MDLSEQSTSELPQTRNKVSAEDGTGAMADTYLASPAGLVHPPPNVLGRAPPRQQMSQLSVDPSQEVYKASGQMGSVIMQGMDASGVVAPLSRPVGGGASSGQKMRATGAIPVGLGGPGDLTSLDRRPVQPKAKAPPRVV